MTKLIFNPAVDPLYLSNRLAELERKLSAHADGFTKSLYRLLHWIYRRELRRLLIDEK